MILTCGLLIGRIETRARQVTSTVCQIDVIKIQVLPQLRGSTVAQR